MEELETWLDSLQCPDCQSPLRTHGGSAEQLCCSGCSRIFLRTRGIWNLLPSSISNLDGKEAEKEGWRKRTDEDKRTGWTPPPEFYLALPYVEHQYYTPSARYLDIVLEYGKPWSGKKLLELGAAECWATRHFVQAGAEAVALDYDDDENRMGKAQILLDHLPIHFLRVAGDAECLPFDASTFDTIFCASVIHHFFDLPQAAREISRILKPGGTLFAIHEAFHPPYYTEKRALAWHEENEKNLAVGIHERSYTAGFYRKLFRKAGMKLDLINPYLDTRSEGTSLIVKPGAGFFGNRHFVPEMLNSRFSRKGPVGWIVRLLLASQIWRIATSPLVFPLIRFQLLNWTQVTKIIVAKKYV
jgi:ubiquinone/menaquinone biosynthesis C-methylase UbiE/uncharacterized protein YbaR (Trm112 family)